MNRTAELEQLYQWDRQQHWHAFTQMAEYEPLVIERAQGVWLEDVQGRRFLDGASSMWCNVHGHAHPKINAAIVQQLAKVAHATSLGMSARPAVELSKRLVDITPAGLEHVFFASDGSSANEVAVKAAFQYWRQCPEPRSEKSKFLAFGEAYHGDTLGSASVGGIPEFHALFQPLLFEVVHAPSPDLRRLPASVPARGAAAYFLAEVETLLREHHKQLAGLIIEPLVQGAAGMVMQPPGFLRGLRELTTRYNVLLIVDEVATGFGRTGTMFACEQEGVEPDFMTIGKGLTGGYLPMAATLTTRKIWQAFLGDAASERLLYHGHTYSGNALCAAAALASLDLFEEEQTLAKLPAKMAQLGEHLAAIAKHPHVAHPRQCGMIAAFDLVADRATGEPYPAAERIGPRIAHEALNRGVWIRRQPNRAYVLPPLSITPDEIDLLMNTVTASVEAATGVPLPSR